MRRWAAVLLGMVLVIGFALPVMAEQEVGGKCSDTPFLQPFLQIGGVVIADKAYGFEPLIRFLVSSPVVGTTTPLQFQVLNCGFQNYIYIFLNGRLQKWHLVRNGDIVVVFPPEGKWLAGNYVIDVVVSTHPRWHISTYGDVAAYTKIGTYIPPTCCEGVEVERFLIEVKSPPPPPCQPPCQPPSLPSKPCLPCLQGGLALLTFFIIANVLYCCCP